ncbi:MAG: hypothetical protein FWG68_01290, partial [Defluviitaleaceae bacterium]|nr:hypothetical protein [Defluviitaleaceae bacterium]
GGGQPDTGGGDGGGQPGTGGGDGGQPDTGGGGTTQPPTTQPPTPPPAPTPAPLPVAPAPLPPIVIPGAPQPPQPSPPTTALVPPIPTSPPQVNVNVSAGTAGGSSAAVSLPSQVNSAGIASLSVTENAINQAIAAVRNSLQTESNVAVVISPTNAGANGINASLNRAVFNRVSAAGVALQISTNNFSVEISPVTLRQISENITGPVRVSVNPVNNLFPAAREAVGNRPVFTFGVRTLSGAAIPGLQSSSMVFGINYQPTDAETVFVARIVGSQITEVPSTFANGVFTWVGTPGGTYGIATR